MTLPILLAWWLAFGVAGAAGFLLTRIRIVDQPPERLCDDCRKTHDDYGEIFAGIPSQAAGAVGLMFCVVLSPIGAMFFADLVQWYTHTCPAPEDVS